MLFRDQNNSRSFRQWIWTENKNKQLLWVVASVIIVEFFLFKYIYPYPNFITDSHTYILAAINNQSISRFPICYSKFLRLISGFTSSHLVLILIQYLLLQASIMYFLLSIGFLLNPAKWLYRLLAMFSSLNPLLLYTSNILSADALFAALSIVWFTQLLWVLYRPSLRLLLFHASTLLLTLLLRYDSIYYPIISILIILIARLPNKSKIISISCITLLLSAHFIITSLEYKKLTGRAILMPAASWQIAGNALAAYEQFPEGYPKEHLPVRYAELQYAITRHLDSIGPILRYFHRFLDYSYQFEQASPLYTYMRMHSSKDSTTSPLKQWAGVADLYGDYGMYLIEKRPGIILKYFVLQNLKYFYTPRKEFLETYNMNKDTIDDVAVYWFELKSNALTPINKDLQKAVANSSQVAMAIINLVFVLSFIGTYVLGGFSNEQNYANSALRLVLLFWLSNLCFSIFAAPIVLRHQLSPMIISYTFGVLLISYIVQEAKSKTNKEPSQEKEAFFPNEIIATFKK